MMFDESLSPNIKASLMSDHKAIRCSGATRKRPPYSRDEVSFGIPSLLRAVFNAVCILLFFHQSRLQPCSVRDEQER